MNSILIDLISRRGPRDTPIPIDELESILGGMASFVDSYQLFVLC
jgi:hypothetical protein